MFLLGGDSDTEFLRSIRIATTTPSERLSSSGDATLTSSGVSTTKLRPSPEAILNAFLQDLTFWGSLPEDCETSNERYHYSPRSQSTCTNSSLATNYYNHHHRDSRYQNRMEYYDSKSSSRDRSMKYSDRSRNRNYNNRTGSSSRSTNSGRDSSHCSSDHSFSSSSSKPIWRTAVDPVTGNTYYYDAITRKTQWHKPAEIRAMEKRKRLERRRQDMVFFKEMEQNLHTSLARGELIPGVPLMETKKEGPPLEPKNVARTISPDVAKSSGRVRTISGMDDLLLAELRGDDAANVVVGRQQHQQQHFYPYYHHPHQQQQRHTPQSTFLSPSQQQQQQQQLPNIVTPESKSGRPPLPTSGLSRRSNSKINDPEILSLHDANLPLTSDSSNQTLRSTTQTFRGTSVQNQQCHPLLQREESELAGEKLLDGPILRSECDLSEFESTKTVSNFNSPPSAGGLHKRRNTGGTIYVQNTMTNPDVKATIKCVCGVYRAHIVQAAERKLNLSPVSVATMNLNNHSSSSGTMNHGNETDIFHDDYDTIHASSYHRQSSSGSASKKRSTEARIPSLSDILAFYQEFFRRSQMEHDTIIMSLIYVERLIKSSNGAVTPTPENWRSILFSSMVLASKVWDDLSMWNIDFSNVSASTAGISTFTLRRINQLELALLTCLNFDVKVPASEYAKYYFLIRTMLLRTGLMQDVSKPLEKADLPAFRKLEVRTSNYQKSKLRRSGLSDRPKPESKKPNQCRRSKSLDDAVLTWFVANGIDGSNYGSDGSRYGSQTSMGPVLRETVCLEQLVG